MSTASSPLQLRLAKQIVSHARASRLPAGHHLTEQSLMDGLGASRAAVRAALTHLAAVGVVEQRPNRGYFVAPAVNGRVASALLSSTGEDERLHAAIAADRLAKSLGDTVTENELMRRYTASRHRLRQVLERIAAEGWIERRGGYGWSFTQMIDSVDAYAESYRLRLILEPAGILEPTFLLDPAAADETRRQQVFVHDRGYRRLTQIEVTNIHAAFHEQIAAMSGNRFLHQAIVRQNQLRRLIEYNRRPDIDRTRRVCAEHLAILDALEAVDTRTAARLMAAHLADAAAEKTRNMSGQRKAARM